MAKRPAVEPLRLALFISDLEGGGAQRRMVTLAEAFAARGHCVDLLTVWPPESGQLANLASSVRLVSLDRFWHHFPLIANKKRRRVMASITGLVPYLRRERPAVLLATSHSVCVVAALASMVARASTRLVLRIDSHLSRPVAVVGERAQRRRIRRARRFFPSADALIAVSKGVAEDVVDVTGIPSHRITAIANPVITPDLRAKIQARVDHPWLSPASPRVLLSVGRLVPQKDYPTLLRAFAKVAAERDVRLLILGEGRERPHLETLARELGVAERVGLPGFVDNPLAFMSRSAVLVLSSAWEGFPSVLVEAMACGCPVVSTNCTSGPAEILEEGAFGPLVPVGDHQALGDAILAVLDRPPAPDTLRKHADTFSVERSVSRYLEVLLR